jgi:hypothetical protein
MVNSFTVLFDYDSMIYKSIHRIASIADIRKWIKSGKTRDWMEKEIVNLAINRLSNMGDGILAEIENTGVDIDRIEYFLTFCQNSKRKLAHPQYKFKRKQNKWVYMIRKALLEMDFAHVHDEWEADDLIKEKALELDERYIICSLDKDLKQIHGFHFDYYRPVPKERQYDAYGNREIIQCRGLTYVSFEEAQLFFWTQMLSGDATDNITGIPSIGKKRAEVILAGVEVDNMEYVVKEKYREVFGDEWKHQFFLHKLLIGLGVDNRP